MLALSVGLKGSSRSCDLVSSNEDNHLALKGFDRHADDLQMEE